MHEPLAIRTFSHFCIRVADAERSLRFYREVFGFTVMNDARMAGGPLEATLGGVAGATGRAIYGQIAGQSVELLELTGVPVNDSTRSTPENVQAFPHYGVGSITFRVPSIENAYRRCLQMSLPVESAPIEIEGCKVFFIDDPDGTRIELLEMPDNYFG